MAICGNSLTGIGVDGTRRHNVKLKKKVARKKVRKPFFNASDADKEKTLEKRNDCRG